MAPTRKIPWRRFFTVEISSNQRPEFLGIAMESWPSWRVDKYKVQFLHVHINYYARVPWKCRLQTPISNPSPNPSPKLVSNVNSKPTLPRAQSWTFVLHNPYKTSFSVNCFFHGDAPIFIPVY